MRNLFLLVIALAFSLSLALARVEVNESGTSRVNFTVGSNGRFQRSSIAYPTESISKPSLIAFDQSINREFLVNDPSDSTDNDLFDGLCSDSRGGCTLRAAVDQLNAIGGGTIRFAFETPTVIELTDGPITLSPGTSAIELVGPGADRLAIRRSSTGGIPDFRIIQIASREFGVSLSGVTIENGRTSPLTNSFEGGCIFVPVGMQLHLDLAIVQNCSSNNGGGIAYRGWGTINRSTIRTNSAQLGGGILVGEEGTLTISNSTVFDNGGNQGAGINNNGDFQILTVTNTTFSGNMATLGGPGDPMGGGIFNYGPVFSANTTIANNGAYQFGGGIADWSALFGVELSRYRNSIIANNSALLAPDTFGYGYLSSGNNLIGRNGGGFKDGENGDIVGTASAPVDPMLGTLANNGGPTQTLSILEGSRAIDAGNNCVANGSCLPVTLSHDQRGVGFDRKLGTNVDIGAYESPFAAVTRRPFFDFDGDSKTDIGIYRPNSSSGSEWWLQRSSNGSSFAVQFGAATDRVAAADYTGDGKTDVAFWRPSNGFWYVLRSEDQTFYAFPFGANGDVPVPADYDADGKADVGVFRPTDSTWYIQRSSDNGTTIQQFGIAGDVPVNADYDGDGKADIAIYRPSLGQWWLSRSTAGNIAYTFGSSTDKTVVGDYTGDGKADVAFWRPSTGEWFILRSEDSSFFGFPFGTTGDTPVPGDYDGDGRNDAGVFRSSNSTWYINRTTAGTLIQQFGTTGDVPLPNAYVR
ncbi:MAG TPA: VCBS repeat-containing protein [Pyrinomonadaceae bacterium]|nr:VCBS repeat-containing protein [Pyrinomonadaceae bacterium]